jgi:hypothetical protein
MTESAVFVGTGSAYPNDRIEPAQALADSGKVQYMCFDRLAERTLALAQAARMENPMLGYDLRMPDVLSRMSKFLHSGGTVIGNFGAANPEQAGIVALEKLRELGHSGMPIAVIYGDDVRDIIFDLNPVIPELGITVKELGDKAISANAYIGAAPIVEALQLGAKVVLGGRLADPSLYVAPIVHELGIDLDDWIALGHATSAGHLMECGAQVTGGNWADPPLRVVPNLHQLGMPYAEITKDRIRLGKLEGTGGSVDVLQAHSQLGYEILDPSDYRTPDVVADFTRVRAEQVGPNVVDVSGATGREFPADLKVLVGVDQGYRAFGEVSYGALRCVERAELARQVIEGTLEPVRHLIDEIRFDLHGVQSLFDDGSEVPAPRELRLRVAARSKSHEVATLVADAVERMFMGPAGGCGITRSVERAIGVYSTFIPRTAVQTSIKLVVT